MNIFHINNNILYIFYHFLIYKNHLDNYLNNLYYINIFHLDKLNSFVLYHKMNKCAIIPADYDRFAHSFERF